MTAPTDRAPAPIALTLVDWTPAPASMHDAARNPEADGRYLATYLHGRTQDDQEVVATLMVVYTVRDGWHAPFPILAWAPGPLPYNAGTPERFARSFQLEGIGQVLLIVDALKEDGKPVPGWGLYLSMQLPEQAGLYEHPQYSFNERGIALSMLEAATASDVRAAAESILAQFLESQPKH